MDQIGSCVRYLRLVTALALIGLTANNIDLTVPSPSSTSFPILVTAMLTYTPLDTVKSTGYVGISTVTASPWPSPQVQALALSEIQERGYDQK
jgi:hypothetical protein